MRAARIGDKIQGSVSHHAGHIIGWTGGENPQPIYCSGHAVTGTQVTGAGKTFIDGSGAARLNDNGTTTCPCDGQGYQNSTGSSKVFIEGRPAVRMGDQVNIHNQGSGKIITGSSKVFIGG